MCDTFRPRRVVATNRVAAPPAGAHGAIGDTSERVDLEKLAPIEAADGNDLDSVHGEVNSASPVTHGTARPPWWGRPTGPSAFELRTWVEQQDREAAPR